MDTEDRDPRSARIFPSGSNWLAERNFSEISPCIGDLWDGSTLETIAEACRYMGRMLPSQALAKLPGLGIYPGESYIALGGQGPYAYKVIRGDSEQCAVYSAADRNGEAGGSVVFHRATDAVKSVFRDWVKLDIAGIYEPLWGGSVKSSEVTAEKFSWEKHRSLYTPEKQEALLKRARTASEIYFSRGEVRTVEQIIEDSKTLYTAIKNPESWFISDPSNISSDLTWGLGVSPQDYLNRVVMKIQENNPTKG